MKVNLIVATAENGTIGKDGSMPWNMPIDLKYFKKITTTTGEENYVLMGRKTYDSIGRPLPNRKNVLITAEKDKSKTKHINAFIYNDIQSAIDQIKGFEFFLKRSHTLYIIGGASIYEQVMNMNIVDKIYHTLIHSEIDGDTFFHLPDGWEVVSEEFHEADKENSHSCTFRFLTKNQGLSSFEALG